jgi:hypothetical protein
LEATKNFNDHPYGGIPAVPHTVDFVSSKGTTSVKEAYMKTEQNNRHSFENQGEEIRRRRSFASI